MNHIAILVPVCSRNQNYTNIDDIPFFTKLYPSFEKTKENEYTYTFFIGFDDDDTFYLQHKSIFECVTSNIITLTGCQHAPAKAWNILAKAAYDHAIGFKYFFQIGDDVELLTHGWTTRFITKLNEHNNIGVVGPCNMINYQQRVNHGRPPVIENAFVSRRHLDIFGYFFYPTIKNWYCDDWLSRIYDPFFSEIQTDILCKNTVIDTRYAIEPRVDIRKYIDEGIQKVKSLNGKHVFSYCIYGNQPKYCVGMIKNLQQIEKLFPFFEVWIHCGNDVPSKYIEQYKSFKNVNIIPYNTTGGRMMSYRFFSIDDPSVSVMIIRDADSRFQQRDIWCNHKFMQSDYSVFTIRDHPYHNRKIMGGQWGMKRIPEIHIQESYSKFQQEYKYVDQYRSDQDFIDRYVYDSPYSKTIAYTSYYAHPKETTVPIDAPRNNKHDFCGNVVLFRDDGSEYYEFSL